MADRISPERRSWNMSRIRGKDTKPERLLRSRLHRSGLRFRLHVAGLPGKPDIVFPRMRTAIFVHGCYWHRHPGCPRATTPKSNAQFWQKKFAETVRRDARKADALTMQGWQVITVWECEIERDCEDLTISLAAQLKRGE